LMPEFSVPKRGDKLKTRYLSDPEIRRTIFAVYQDSAATNPEVNQLLEKLKVGF